MIINICFQKITFWFKKKRNKSTNLSSSVHRWSKNLPPLKTSSKHSLGSSPVTQVSQQILLGFGRSILTVKWFVFFLLERPEEGAKFLVKKNLKELITKVCYVWFFKAAIVLKDRLLISYVIFLWSTEPQGCKRIHSLKLRETKISRLAATYHCVRRRISPGIY